ncbi:MAG: chemotaxis protein CheW [Nitrospiraceae bacterium]|nr:chemotaxis protein CheW [Nitrospiraceae bacterium]
MDLARLRKKLKESGGRRPPDEAREEARDENRQADELPSEQASEPVVESVKAPPVSVPEPGTDYPGLEEQESAPEMPPAYIEEPFQIPADEPPQADATAEYQPPELPVAAQPQSPADAAQAPVQAESEDDFFGEGKAAEDEKLREFLSFKLASENYAFKVDEIEEIIKPQRITAVPRMEAFVTGVSSLRGKIIPVIDLRRRLGLSGAYAPEKHARVLILRGPKGSIGVWVDSVDEVVRIPDSSIQEPPAHLSDVEVRFIEGIALWEGRFISIMKSSEVLKLTKEPDEKQA